MPHQEVRLILFWSVVHAIPSVPEDAVPAPSAPPTCIDADSDPDRLRSLVDRYRLMKIEAELDFELEFRCGKWTVFYYEGVLCTGRRMDPDVICTFPTSHDTFGAAMGDDCPARSLEDALRLQLERVSGCPDRVVFVAPPPLPNPPLLLPGPPSVVP